MSVLLTIALGLGVWVVAYGPLPDAARRHDDATRSPDTAITALLPIDPDTTPDQTDTAPKA